jgi:hypothetical protein
MPLRPVRRRRDEIENLFDGLAYLDAIANARHPRFSGVVGNRRKGHTKPLFLDLAPNTHGEPNCFRTGLLNSIFHMARNRHIIALFHTHELSLFELQGRFPAHHDDPLVLILIIPKAERAAVGPRNDTLDLDGGCIEQAQRLL